MHSKEPFTVRFGIEMAMTHYLDEDFDRGFASKVARLRSSEYYVNMMIAWFFATALTKQWNSAIGYIEEKRLDRWTHNKTIQKAIESRRVSEEKKAYLRTLRR